QKISRKTLFVVDEHGVLFDSEISVHDRLNSLFPLKYLTFRSESMNGICVVFTVEMMKMTNCVPRELILLAKVIRTDPHSLDEVKEIMKCFENDRIKQFYDLAKTYYNSLPTTSKNETRLALADIFLPENPRGTTRFEW
ncbi:8861_t:CDS:2, partial [Funneliformis caledonium]